MKRFIKFIATALLLHLTALAFGQYVPIPIDYKLEKSTLIVEGKVIAKQSYFGKDNEIYTENIIEVDRVFKGEISQNQIVVITMGGTVNGTTTSWSHLLGLSLSEYGAFFLKPSKRPLREGSNYKAFDVFSGVQGFYHYLKKDYGYFAKATLDKYNTISEFYSKIGVPENQRNEEFTLFDELNKDSCLTYNLELVNAGSSLTEGTMVYLNVLAKVNQGEYKLNQAELYLKYSTEWFYDNMVTGGYLTFTQGVFGQDDYDLTIEDYDSDVLRLNLEALSTNVQDLTLIDGNYKLIATIGVTLKSFSDELPFEQDFSIADYTNNYRTSEGYLKDFDCIMIEMGANCDMEITEMTELAAAGLGVDFSFGIHGAIELKGVNFLDDDAVFTSCVLPEKHRVKFETIDGNWIAPLEGDYLVYTDTFIKVRVPTAGYKNNSDNLYVIPDDLNDAVACTGKVRVCKDRLFKCQCFVTSDEDLYVPFAARNTIQTNSSGCKESVRNILRNLDSDGGYTIRFNNNFKNYAGAVAAFVRALNTWRCATRVNFKVDVVNNPIGLPGFCEIRFNDLPVGTRGGTSLTIKECGVEPNIDFAYSQGFRMTFNSNMDWHADTSMVTLNWDDLSDPPLQGDLESTALHELGHAHLLLHTCNEVDVMVRPGPKDYRRELTGDDEAGGMHISILSNEADAPMCDSTNMVLIDHAVCEIVLSIIETSKGSVKVDVFPNPTSDKLNVRFDTNGESIKGTLLLINSSGVQMLAEEISNSSSFEIDVSNYPSGVYYFIFKEKGTTFIPIGTISKIK